MLIPSLFYQLKNKMLARRILRKGGKMKGAMFSEH